MNFNKLQNQTPEKISLKCCVWTDEKYPKSVNFIIGKTTPLEKLKESYATQTGIPTSQLKFLCYDGEIKDKDTPKSRNLMNSDIIEVFCVENF